METGYKRHLTKGRSKIYGKKFYLNSEEDRTNWAIFLVHVVRTTKKENEEYKRLIERIKSGKDLYIETF